MNTTSTQGVVGKEVTLKADIGVKEAGVAVTFNVTAGSKLNKDHIQEVLTNAEGIATYSYTQYVSGEKDEVVAYPTGAPAHRDLATVYWGVDTILAITADDKKGNSINNGENKVYKAVYKDPKTGKAVANQKLHVTFAENVETTINKVSNATVNGNTPYQLTNGKTVAATVTTNSNGEATFTVSGSNAKVTPIVFVDNSETTFDNNRRVATGNDRLEVTELQAKAEELSIGAVQSTYTIDVTRDGQEEAAINNGNGREYNIVVKTKDGKVAANEWVNVSFDEILDRNMNTNTKAYFVDGDDKVVEAGYKKTSLEGFDKEGQKIGVKLDSKGEATFRIASNDKKDYATPVVWLDVNSSNAKQGQLDDGEPNKVAAITYFAEAKLSGGIVKATNKAAVDKDKKVKEFKGDETATFEYFAANQSGNEMPLEDGYDRIDTTFTVFNTGDHDATVTVGEGKDAKETIISHNRSESFTVNSATPSIKVNTANESTALTVQARGTAHDSSSRNKKQSIDLGSSEVKVTFKSTKDVGTEHVGFVSAFDIDKKEITFVDKNKISYKDKNVTFFDERIGSTKTLTEKEFADNVLTSKVRLLINGDNYKFILIQDGSSVGLETPKDLNFIDKDLNAGEIAGEITFTALEKQSYKVFLGDTEIKLVDKAYTVAENTKFNDEKIRVETTKGGFTASTTFTITDVKTADEGASALTKINTAALSKVWDGVTITDFATIGVIGVTDKNFNTVKSATQNLRAINGSDLTADQIQELVPAADVAVAKATVAVERAEASKAQDDVTAAKDLVDALDAGTVKEALQVRITKVQTELDVKVATAAVVKAEASKKQDDVDSAQGLVDALPADVTPATTKADLVARIDAIVVTTP